MISSASIAFRSKPSGHLFDVAGMSYFPREEDYLYLLGFSNTKIVKFIMKFIAPTLNFQVGDIAKIPIIFADDYRERINELVRENINIAKEDWDSFENSWDFCCHPFLLGFKNSLVSNNLKEIYEHWEDICNDRFDRVKRNEEELNKIFISIYGLEDELDSEIDDKNITIRKADRTRDVKSFISYAVGCMFGRYSLDQRGLSYAGGSFDISKYKSYDVVSDNIIAITDEIYFSGDIVDRFKNFVKVVYGEDEFVNNFNFIAEALGKRGTETSEDTVRRYFNNDFYSDHIKMYQKRPIYWLFDSGKKNGFKCLVYMHRYDENTVPKIRLDYLHRMQNIYDKLLVDLNYRLTTNLSTIDKKETQRRQVEIVSKLQEIKEYDEKIAHIANQRISINLDDGVRVNYEKFVDILAKIK